jgi:hypothetical protein
MRHRSILAKTRSSHSHGSLKAGRTPAGFIWFRRARGISFVKLEFDSLCKQ